MRPTRMTQLVTITTPSLSTVDPKTGNEVPGALVEKQVRAYLAQRPPAELGSQFELNADQRTAVVLWTMLVPRGTVLTRDSTVTDESGRVLRVVGDPADRPAHAPKFRAAALRFVSDLGV